MAKIPAARGVWAATLLTALAGCSSSDSAGEFDAANPSLSTPPASLAANAPAEVGVSLDGASCPKVTLREGTAILEKKVGNEIDYVAAISDTSRNCKMVDGRLVMQIGVRGRVTPGPVAQDRAVQLPIRVAIIRGEDVVYSELGQQSVQVSKGNGVAPFTYVDQDVTLTVDNPKSLQIFAGFDEGPPE